MLRQKTRSRTPLVQVMLLLLFCLLAATAYAQTPFYQGKTITLLVGSGPGGMGDLRAKALAAGLMRNIPGNPTIVFQYMAGAGGRKATNHIYSTAKPDGLTLLRVSSSIIPTPSSASPACSTTSTSSIILARPSISCFTCSSRARAPG